MAAYWNRHFINQWIFGIPVHTIHLIFDFRFFFYFQDLVQLEREKLDVLKDIRQSLKEANEMNNNFQKQIIELKKAKLALEERRLSLEEMRFARPSISVPVILPDESDPGEQTTNLNQ
ncbi:myb-related transcription partner of profilin-like protein [Labeo rohita]|uniref:Myb-related transcription partner of profilin-like protein n=1 Tax=Labeo rohita TaxID=84645 RepID=A0A498LH07_LABRO|nr:myb-related transcription partner of profilin-like protein [Labeo rohita]